MKKISPCPESLKGYNYDYITWPLVCFLFMFFSGSINGQTKTVADQAAITTSGNNRYDLCLGVIPCNFGPTVVDVTDAENDDNKYARMYASPGLLASLGRYKGGIEFTFPQTLVANKWSYVRIGADNSLLRSLLGGSLGKSLGTVLGAVLLGNQEIEIEALENSTSRLKRTNTQGFDTDRVRLIKDANSNYFIAIRPAGPYNKIRLTNQSTSVAGLFQEYVLDAYSAVSYTEDPLACGRPTFTSFDGGSGLGLKVADLDNQRLERAIDQDVDTYSELKSSGVLDLTVGRSLSQFFYFNNPSSTNHTFNIKLGLASGGVANLDLLGGLQVVAWNGNQAVYTRTLSDGLLNGVNIVELFDNPQTAATLTFAPGKIFDRVEVRLNAIVGLDLVGNGIRIYDVQRYSGESGCNNPNIVVPTETPAMLSQKSCAIQVVSSGNADFAQHTVDGKNDTYATLQASSGFIAGSGAYSAHIEMGFGSSVSAGTTTYVRIDFDSNQLGKLLDGSVGSLLGNTVDDLLFGNHYFVVEAKSGNTVVLSRSSSSRFSNTAVGATGTGDVKIVQDKNGYYYLAIRSGTPFSSIRITERLSATVGLGTIETMNVYHACYPTGALDCEQSFATYSESEGISLDLLGVGKAGVTDAHHVIDSDINTSSKISIGAVGVGGNMLQSVQFHGVSSDRDHFRIKMKMQVQGTVTADIIGSIIIKAYQGTDEVYSQRLNEKLLPGVDVLQLLSNGQMINIPIAPGKAFDRVAVGIASLVETNVFANPLEVYSIERFSDSCPDPELTWEPKTASPFNQQDCGTMVTSFEHVNFPFEAITDSPDADTYAILSAGAGIAGGLGTYNSHLELKYAAPVAAHEVSYIRVDSETNLFKSLLGGSLGDALAGVLGSVALGDQYIQVKIKDAAGNQIGATYNSQLGLNTEFVKLVQDVDGRFYLAVTAAYPYQSIRLEYYHRALVGGMGSSSIKVYSMCRETQVDLCEQAAFTSWDGTGIAVDIADITNGGVVNPDFAIDDNSSNYSALNLGLAGIGASVSQTVYFKSKSTTNDSIRVRLQLRNPGILNVDLLGQSRLKLYNGEHLVYNETLATGLINNLDLLALFNSGGVQALTFFPNVVYDRAKIEISSVAGLNASAPIHLYGMSRVTTGCPDPDFMAPPYRSSVCADVVETGTSVADEYDTYAVDDISNAVDGNHNSYASIRSGAGVILGVNNVSGKLTFGYQADAPAGRISYIRIAENSGLLEALLSGSLGSVVGGVVDGLLLGNHYFTVDVQDAAGNNLVSGNSQSSFTGANGNIKIVQDKVGRYYIALTADQAYRKVVIKTFTESVVGVAAQDNALHVYGMCYETNFDGCAEAVTTSWDGSGLSVGVTGIGEYGVRDAFQVLDNNNNGDFSTLSLGTLNVTGHIQQNIQFNKTIEANSLIKLKMSVGQGSVDAAVFGRMRLIAYNAGVEVYNQTIQNAVIGNVNLAQLFDNGAASEITFSPTVVFDEVALRLDALAGASLLVPNVRLYYITPDCQVANFEAWKSYQEAGTGTAIAQVKGGEEVVYNIHIRNTGTVDLENYIVTDAIPTHTTYVPGSADSNGGAFADGEVTFQNVNVPAGATQVLTFRVKVADNLTGVNKISNVAFVKKDATDPGTGTVPPADPSNPVDPDPTVDPGTTTDIPVQQIKTVTTWKAYAVTGGLSTTSVRGGENVTYTLYIRNVGNQDLTGLTVSDAIPGGTTFQSANNGGIHQDGAVSFSGIDLPVGGTTSVSFVVTVNEDLTGRNTIDNIAYVKETPDDPGTPTTPADPTDPSAGPDPAANPGDPTSIPVDDNFDVVLWKAYKVQMVGTSTFDPAITSVSGGEQVEYTLYVKNRGNKALTNVTLADPLTPGIILEPGYTASTTIATLGVGETKSYAFRVKVDADLTGIQEIRNVATIVSNEISTARESHPPVDNLNPTVPDETKIGTLIAVTHIHDVNIELNGVSDGVNSGMAVLNDKITYTITVTNSGNKNLTALTVVGDVPATTIFDESPSGGVLSANDVVFPPFDLAVGETKTFQYIVGASSITPPTPITNEAVVNFENPQGAPITKSDTHSMPTACTPVLATDLQLADSGPICLGESITLTANLSGLSGLDPTVLSSIIWYSSYNAGTGTLSGEIGVGQSIDVIPTSLVTTYYAAVVSTDYCFQNPPATINVVVNDVPVRPIIASVVTDQFCTGEVVPLTISNVQAGATYTWFRNGTSVGTGTSYDADATGVYTVRASLGACPSEPSVGVDLTVYPRPVANDIQVIGHESAVCEGASVTLQASLVASPSTIVSNPVFHWYSDAALTNRVYTGSTLSIHPATTITYYVTVDGDAVCENAPGTAKEVTINVNPTPIYTINGALSYGIEVGQSVTLPTISTSSAIVTWYDDAGTNMGAITTTRSFDAVGTYTYTAVISEADHCTVSVSVVIHVFSEDACPPVYSRIYATDASSYGVSRLVVPLGAATDIGQAADGDVETHSTLTEGLNLLGGLLTGQTYQTLKWNSAVAAGTPVSVKLGKNLSTVNAVGTLRVVAVDGNGIAVSTVHDVEPKLVEVLGGLNVYEYTFTPVNQNGQAVPYSGVKVYFAGVASILQTAYIYEAYYHQSGTVDCGSEEIFDVLHGIENPISVLGVANILAGVDQAENAVDNDPATYAVMNNIAAVNAKTRLEVLYNIPALVGDKLLINLSTPGALLSVQALQSFTVQPYLGDVPVGQPVSQDGIVLKVDILSGGTEAVVTYTAGHAFDRIKILYGGVADVLTQLRVHDISRQVPAIITGDNNDNKFEICEGGDITIVPADNCTTYRIYSSATAGNIVDVKNLGAGIYTFYVQTVRFGTCEVGERTAIEVTINALPVPPIVVDQVICQTPSASTVSYQVTALPGHNLIFYADQNSTTPLVAVPTANSANVGIYTVYVSQRSAEGCESIRIPVRITVTRTATTADIIVNDVTICEGESLTLSAGSSTVSNPVFKFYTDASLTTQITNVTVAPTTSTSYYVTVSGDGVCENTPGQAAILHVNVVVTAAPTITDAAPEFCISDRKTLADLPVVGTTIKWYAAATGGTALANSTLLQDGVTYYASQRGSNCESVARLAVTPIVKDCTVKLSIKKQADDDRVVAGQNTSFTLTITNNGPGIVEVGDVILLEDIPRAGLEITDFTIASNYGSISVTDNKATITVDNIVPVNGSIIVKVLATVATDAPATISNAIKVWGPDTPPDEDPDDEDETPPIPVDREYNLTITKVADEARVKAGENTTFTVTVRNDGPSAIATGKVIQLGELPSTGLTITGYAITSGSASIVGTGNSATLTTTQVMDVGADIVVKVTALVSADAPATISNAIKVWGPDTPPDDDPDDEDETPPIPVDREYNLTITKVADEARVKAGESTTFTVTITNNGPAVIEIGKAILLGERPGNGVTITGYEMISTNATLSGTGNQATLTTNAKIGVQETIVVRIIAKVDDDAPATITNGIDVWGPDTPPDEDPDDDDDTPEIPVDYPLIEAVDDFAEVKAGLEVKIAVLNNDIKTKWDIDPAKVQIAQQPTFGKVEVLPDGEVIYTAETASLGEVSFKYTVKDIKGRTSNEAIVTVNVIDNPLEIPNVITPNGDNVNDYFVIRGLELYDSVHLTIMNRWGSEVYKNSIYNNEWDGRGLNEGTYFYVLQLSRNGKVTKYTGSILIKRN